jgi:hypothetical protein
MCTAATVNAVLITSSTFSAITGQTAPVEFSTLETRVVTRLSSLLARDLTEFTTETVPTDLTEAIAWGVATLNASTAPIVPTGVVGFNIAGEYQVQLAPGICIGADGVSLPASYSHCVDLGGRCVTLALRHRRVAL